MTYDPFDPFNALVAETPPEVLAEGQKWVKQQFYEEFSMYQDFFLRFADQAEADSVLFDEQTNVQGDVVETVKVPKYAAVDVIGTIYKPTGKTVTTTEGPMPEMAPIDGWHVNVRHLGDAPELDPYKVFPKQAVRGWA